MCCALQDAGSWMFADQGSWRASTSEVIVGCTSPPAPPAPPPSAPPSASAQEPAVVVAIVAVGLVLVAIVSGAVIWQRKLASARLERKRAVIPKLATRPDAECKNPPGAWHFMISYTQRNDRAVALVTKLEKELVHRGYTAWLDVEMNNKSEAAMKEAVEHSMVVIAVIIYYPNPSPAPNYCATPYGHLGDHREIYYPNPSPAPRPNRAPYRN